jgi:hypothetical protein
MKESSGASAHTASRSSSSGFVTEESVYGTILVSGVIVVSGAYSATSWQTLISVVGTVIVFWAAHVFAGTVAEHGVSDGRETSLGAAFRRSLRRSFGFLLSALLPALVLLLGALHVVPDMVALWVALWLGVIVLGVLGYRAFAARGSSWPIRIFGCVGTAAFGVAMILLKAAIH